MGTTLLEHRSILQNMFGIVNLLTFIFCVLLLFYLSFINDAFLRTGMHDLNIATCSGDNYTVFQV
jgi:hypothetical protein